MNAGKISTHQVLKSISLYNKSVRITWDLASWGQDLWMGRVGKMHRFGAVGVNAEQQQSDSGSDRSGRVSIMPSHVNLCRLAGEQNPD